MIVVAWRCRFIPWALAVLVAACEAPDPLAPAFAVSKGGPSVGAPTQLTASALASRSIGLTWTDNATNETGFEVHRSTSGLSGPYTLRATTGSNVTTYGDGGLDPSTQYCYEVRALRKYDGKTSYSVFSTPACATTPAPPPPPPGLDAPNLTATPRSSGSVDVSWVDNSTTEDGFRVERSLDAGATWAFVGVSQGPNMTSYYDYSRASEQVVCYRVFAYNSQGSSQSNVDCTTPPAAPSALAAAAIDFQTVGLTWTDNSAVEDGYEVRRAADGVPWSTIADLPPNSIGYRDIVATDTRYMYRVSARKDGGYSDASSTVSVVVASTPPAAPPSADAIPVGSNAVYLTWADNATNESGFRVERSTDGSASWQVAGTTGPATASSGIMDADRASEQPVCYRVIAFNNVGDSPPSNTDCTVPPAAPNGLVAIAVAGSAIDLTWTDNSGVEDGYEVQRLFMYCDDETGCHYYYYPIATLGPNVTSYRDLGLNPGEFYSYRVYALKDGGRSDSSNEATTTAP